MTEEQDTKLTAPPIAQFPDRSQQFGCPTVAATILNTLSKADVFPNLSFLICKKWMTSPTASPWSRMGSQEVLVSLSPSSCLISTFF